MELCDGMTRNLQVNGKYRYKYFECAQSSSNQRYVLDVESDTSSEDDTNKLANHSNSTCKASYKNSGSQTEDHLQKDREYIDIMELRQFSFSRKALNEANRMDELKHPPIKDEATFLIHKEFQGEQDRKEFQAREEFMRIQVIEKIEEYKNLLRVRDKQREQLVRKRIEEIWRKKQNGNNYSTRQISSTRKTPQCYSTSETYSKSITPATLNPNITISKKLEKSKRKRERYISDLNILKELIKNSVSERRSKVSHFCKTLQETTGPIFHSDVSDLLNSKDANNHA